MELLDPYVPTSKEQMAKMLEDIKPSDVFIDLGSGDGRFVAEASRRGAEAYGIEIVPELVRKSQEWLDRHELKGKIIEGDLLTHDLSRYTYITSSFRGKIYPQILEKCKRECKKGTVVMFLHEEKVII